MLHPVVINTARRLIAGERRIRACRALGWQDIPVIVITARDLDAEDRARLNSGVQSVLVKETFRPAELVERIRRLTNGKPRVGAEMEAAS